MEESNSIGVVKVRMGILLRNRVQIIYHWVLIIFSNLTISTMQHTNIALNISKLISKRFIQLIKAIVFFLGNVCFFKISIIKFKVGVLVGWRFIGVIFSFCLFFFIFIFLLICELGICFENFSNWIEFSSGKRFGRNVVEGDAALIIRTLSEKLGIIFHELYTISTWRHFRSIFRLSITNIS